jgi:glycosyltransferase involved in cell wall biosynthesis
MASSEDQNNIPYVAVFMVTYNHERYIRQAIESIVKQRTTFKFRLYIGEDCSKDNTRSICISLAEQYPDLITLICTEQNNLSVNVENIWKATLGSGAKYIAFCEGDDFWNDSDKLQKQVDFLDANPDFTMCFSDVNIIDEIGDILPDKYPRTGQEVYTIEDIILSWRNIMPTPTLVFRNILPYPFPDFFIHGLASDIAVQLLLADKGKAKHFAAKMATYRNHHSSFSNAEATYVKTQAGYLKLFHAFNKYFDFRYDAIFKKRFLDTAKMELIAGAKDKHGLGKIKHYFEKMPEYIKYSDKINLKEMLYYHAILFFSFLLKKAKK